MVGFRGLVEEHARDDGAFFGDFGKLAARFDRGCLIGLLGHG